MRENETKTSRQIAKIRWMIHTIYITCMWIIHISYTHKKSVKRMAWCFFFFESNYLLPTRDTSNKNIKFKKAENFVLINKLPKRAVAIFL